MKLILKADYDNKKYEVYSDYTRKYNPYLIFYVKGGNRYLQAEYADFMSAFEWIKEQYIVLYDVSFEEVLEK